MQASVLDPTSHASATSGSLLDELLAEQQQTAVDRFAQLHVDATGPAGAEQYRDLIPLTAPGPGEQYAFEVDLDACSGCKSCVAACHNLNGLENGEAWRTVGMLHGGDAELPVLQHVTTACHHCVDPACLTGCPVKAYDKDPQTGIVRHLDDQCIGCQYCIFKCPYDVPVYSRSKGIVRKCDMCHDRLSAGEAPACVQSCPNQAIRIKTVTFDKVVEVAETGSFLPGAPDPGYTLPTTSYVTRRALPRNLLPADYFSARRQTTHWSLVVMLVLTQMSVGAFTAEQFLFRSSTAGVVHSASSANLVFALLLGLSGLGAAVLHLGRPRYAFRALLGLRTSWLSREILAFGPYAAAATAYVGLAVATQSQEVATTLQQVVGWSAAALGIAAVGCSIMIYVDTQRPCWVWSQTAPKFFLSAAILGLPLTLFVSIAISLVQTQGAGVGAIVEEFGTQSYLLLLALVLLKLAHEFSVLTHLARRQHTPLKQTALLLTGDLSITTVKRCFFGLMGGVALPAALIVALNNGFHPMFIAGVTLLTVILLLIGELLERHLFFASSVAPKMPGAPAA